MIDPETCPHGVVLGADAPLQSCGVCDLAAAEKRVEDARRAGYAAEAIARAENKRLRRRVRRRMVDVFGYAPDAAPRPANPVRGNCGGALRAARRATAREVAPGVRSQRAKRRHAAREARSTS